MPGSIRSGKLRLAQGVAAGAAADFRRALAQRPGNRTALAGLAQASRPQSSNAG